jgi:hypothetical protein
LFQIPPSIDASHLDLATLFSTTVGARPRPAGRSTTSYCIAIQKRNQHVRYSSMMGGNFQCYKCSQHLALNFL